MSKQNNNAGAKSPHKQGVHEGKGRTFKSRAAGGGKKLKSQGIADNGSSAIDAHTPKVGMSKINESGKGSGDR
jgi:hypothetical protein